MTERLPPKPWTAEPEQHKQEVLGLKETGFLMLLGPMMQKYQQLIEAPGLPEEPGLGILRLGGLLADWQIKARTQLPMGNPCRLVIDPFCPPTKETSKVSHGLSSYGYDLRLGRRFRIFQNTAATIVDVLTLKESDLVPHEGDSCIIPPNSFVLAESIEHMEIPEDVLCVVLGKSTYARAGIGLPMTPLEPGWRGKVTLEIANHTPLPARIHAGQGIGQCIFLEGSAPCAMPYNRKAGASYQDQKGLELPRA